MSRPRKLSTEEMIQIVDAFFESHGDPVRMKCSLIAEYAASLDVCVKAYDFRRDASVRQRIDDLREAASPGVIAGIAYRSIDADAFLERNHTRDMIRIALLELDEAWRGVYEKAAELSRANASLLTKLVSKNQAIKTATDEKDESESRAKSLERRVNAMTLENRYLRKSIREHLYPSLANEILKGEGVLEQVNTGAAPAAVAAMADQGAPESFSASVAGDRRVISREEQLLGFMASQIRSDFNA